MGFFFFIFKFNWYTLCIEHDKLREYLNVTCWDQQSITINVWSIVVLDHSPTHHEQSFSFVWSFDPQYLCEVRRSEPIFTPLWQTMTSTKMQHSFHAKFHIQVILLLPYEMHLEHLKCISAVLSMCYGAQIISHIQVLVICFFFSTPNS